MHEPNILTHTNTHTNNTRTQHTHTNNTHTTHTHTTHTHTQHTHSLFNKFVLELMTSVGFGTVVNFQNGKGGEIYHAARDIAGLTEDSFHREGEGRGLLLLDAAMGKTSCPTLGELRVLHTHTHTYTDIPLGHTDVHARTHTHCPYRVYNSLSEHVTFTAYYVNDNFIVLWS